LLAHKSKKEELQERRKSAEKDDSGSDPGAHAAGKSAGRPLCRDRRPGLAVEEKLSRAAKTKPGNGTWARSTASRSPTRGRATRRGTADRGLRFGRRTKQIAQETAEREKLILSGRHTKTSRKLGGGNEA
jgi:hypothetical protein